MCSNQKFHHYIALLDCTYSAAFEFLQKQYGRVKDDYFHEQSYERFKQGKIKNITRGNYSRTNQGLVVHHYYENEIPNLSRPSVIKQKNVSFSKQKRINLVYCDFFEHLILHALISKEQNNKELVHALISKEQNNKELVHALISKEQNNKELVHALISKEQNDKELGFLGYKNGIFPRLYKWYVEGKEPKQKWLMNCFNTAWLNKNDAINILRKSIMLLPKCYKDERHCQFFCVNKSFR
ncbi:MAG: hypothetical protein LKF01_03885 [Lactobacillus sp.]|nr:hypothetical protein [Lactobacillus sp.]MCH4068626.1 hypothetical protein [Lactobacillus sp.]MCI1304521.1 hypothetical protein [Lactobacillus sp.]MCI1330617.1 hypothetical protein [Lactobacillus sp.]MCI1360041.1 hypothetical protein [Lactobacillus sp.]